jgi:hypothetical protein
MADGGRLRCGWDGARILQVRKSAYADVGYIGIDFRVRPIAALRVNIPKPVIVSSHPYRNLGFYAASYNLKQQNGIDLVLRSSCQKYYL